MSSPSNDAAIAALTERLNAMIRSFDEFRETAKEERVENRAQFARISADTARQFADMNLKVQTELKPLRETQEETRRIMNRASGGYLVLAGLAGLLTWLTGSFDKLWKFWSQ